MGTSSPRREATGFTLIELMVGVAVVGILLSIAMPLYTQHTTSARINDAVGTLPALQVKMEQWFQDNLTYRALSSTECGVSMASANTVNQNFTFTCVASSASAYIITATGKSAMAGFTYTINQTGVKTSTVTATGWAGTRSDCWITKRGGEC